MRSNRSPSATLAPCASSPLAGILGTPGCHTAVLKHSANNIDYNAMPQGHTLRNSTPDIIILQYITVSTLQHSITSIYSNTVPQACIATEHHRHVQQHNKTDINCTATLRHILQKGPHTYSKAVSILQYSTTDIYCNTAP